MRWARTGARAAPAAPAQPPGQVKQLGMHSLVCTIRYKTAAGEPRELRKLFKFQVQKPLEVKTKPYAVGNDVYLEAQIQNIMPTPLMLDKVVLHPAAESTVVDLNVADGNGEPVFSRDACATAPRGRAFAASASPVPTPQVCGAQGQQAIPVPRLLVARAGVAAGARAPGHHMAHRDGRARAAADQPAAMEACSCRHRGGCRDALPAP